MISVGIVGASGYTGEELARLLANHPNVELKSLTSKTHEGKEINTIFKLDEKIPGKFKSPQVLGDNPQVLDDILSYFNLVLSI